MKAGLRILMLLSMAVVATAAFSGCASSYRGITSGITGCAEHEIRLSNARYGYNRMWTATCRDVTYSCRCSKPVCECVPTPTHALPSAPR